MRANKLWIGGLLLAFSFMLVSYSHAQRQTAHKEKVMREKLVHAQKLLEGISTQDFNLIRTHAERLRTMSLDADWNPHPSHLNDRRTGDILKSLDQLVEAAKEEDVRGAALGYMALTLTCVDCHNNSHGKDIALSDQLKDETTIVP